MQSVCVCYNLFFSKVNLHLPPIYCLAASTHHLAVGPLRNEDTTVAGDVGRVLSKALGNGCCCAIRFLTKSSWPQNVAPPKIHCETLLAQKSFKHFFSSFSGSFTSSDPKTQEEKKKKILAVQCLDCRREKKRKVTLANRPRDNKPRLQLSLTWASATVALCMTEN